MALAQAFYVAEFALFPASVVQPVMASCGKIAVYRTLLL
jgi:hypothetical protein